MKRWPGNADKEKTTFGGLSRSRLMSRIRSRGNLTTEIKMVALLRKKGIKGWRRHQSLPGNPDFIWYKKKVALFIDGCFWHGDACKRNLTPKKNIQQWQDKITKNRRRDRRINRELRRNGWHVLRVWECQLAKKPEVCYKRLKAMLDKV